MVEVPYLAVRSHTWPGGGLIPGLVEVPYLAWWRSHTWPGGGPIPGLVEVAWWRSHTWPGGGLISDGDPKWRAILN